MVTQNVIMLHITRVFGVLFIASIFCYLWLTRTINSNIATYGTLHMGYYTNTEYTHIQYDIGRTGNWIISCPDNQWLLLYYRDAAS